MLIDLEHFTSHTALHILLKGLIIGLIPDEFGILLLVETVKESVFDIGNVSLLIDHFMLRSNRIPDVFLVYLLELLVATIPHHLHNRIVWVR